MSSKEKPPRLTVYLPDLAKSELEQMANQTGLSQSQLVVMATLGLLANYKARGNGIFTELLKMEPKKEEGIL
ncbi:CopG family transcriptional regulator [Paenibacillus sp. 843]|uniref:ribbon-helix-helix domain-containing protein n=1 Tax=Paenibacillus sp. 843 TaxID=3341795 RepID=UPI0037279420